MKKIIFIFTTCLFIMSCSNNDNTEDVAGNKTATTILTLTDKQIKSVGLITGFLEEKSISSILKVNGKIDVPPQNTVSVSVPLGGYLKSTHLLPGLRIKKGEIIAVIEDQQYIQLQQDYLTAGIKLKYLESEYNRQKELNISKASSDKVFQQTEADYISEKIEVKSLYEKLRLIGITPADLNENTLSRSVNIIAPIDGYVASVNANIGKYVNPSEVLFELVNPTDIHLALTVFERDLDKLYIGQKLKAFTNHNSEKKYECEIILISQNLSAERSAEVHCHFENYNKALIPGMYMNSDIEIKTNDALVLPEDAVVTFENKQYVFIQKTPDQFEMTEVKVGNTENGFVEITSLKKNTKQKFVFKGAYTLLMALKNRSEG